MEELLKAVMPVASALGLDAVVIIATVIGTYVLRLFLKPKGENTPVLYALILGAVLGVLTIILNALPTSVWLRTVVGYPIVSIGIYMLYRKAFPNSSLLKAGTHEEASNDGNNTNTKVGG